MRASPAAGRARRNPHRRAPPCPQHNRRFHRRSPFTPAHMCIMHIYRDAGMRVNKKRAKYTCRRPQLRELHGAVLDIVSAINRPQRDEALIRASRHSARPGAISAAGVASSGSARSASSSSPTASGATTRRSAGRSPDLKASASSNVKATPADGRIREAIVSPKGQGDDPSASTPRATAWVGRCSATWDARDIDELTRLMRQFAAAINDDALDRPPPSPARNPGAER